MFGYSIKPKSQNPSTSFDPRWELLPWPPGRRNERISPREKIGSLLSYQRAIKTKSSWSKIGRKKKEKAFPIKDRKKNKRKKEISDQSSEEEKEGKVVSSINLLTKKTNKLTINICSDKRKKKDGSWGWESKRTKRCRMRRDQRVGEGERTWNRLGNGCLRCCSERTSLRELESLSDSQIQHHCFPFLSDTPKQAKWVWKLKRVSCWEFGTQNMIKTFSFFCR